MDFDNRRCRMLIDYRKLGTISGSELIQAIYDDIAVMELDFSIRYYTGAKLWLFGSNEYGDPRQFLRPSGEQVRWLHSCHFRPACLDYDL